MYLQAMFAAFDMQHSKHQHVNWIKGKMVNVSDRKLNSDVLFRKHKDSSSPITVGPWWMKIISTGKIDNFSHFVFNGQHIGSSQFSTQVLVRWYGVENFSISLRVVTSRFPVTLCQISSWSSRKGGLLSQSVVKVLYFWDKTYILVIRIRPDPVFNIYLFCDYSWNVRTYLVQEYQQSWALCLFFAVLVLVP